MAGRQRTTFAKLQRERARQEKQAAKRARRQGLAVEPEPTEQRDAGDFFGPNGEIPDWLQEASPESSPSSTPTSEPAPSAPSSSGTPTPKNGSDAG